MKKTARVLQAVFITVGVLLLVYSVTMAALINYNAGITLLAAAGIFLIACGAIARLLLRHIWMIVLLCALLLCAVSLLSFIAFHATQDTVEDTEDAILVLGAGVDGDRVPPQLANRLDTAIALFSRNPDALIIVSGGQGPDESVTEAYAMEQYLLARGIPQEHIVREEASSSTYQNISNSLILLQARLDTPYTVAIVTSEYHLYRAGKIAETFDMDFHLIGAKTEWYEIPIRYTRECLAVVKMWLLDR